MWVTDIDSVWVFDLKTKKGKKLPLPGITFANDPTVIGNSLYVSDNRSDKLVKVDAGRFPQCEIAQGAVIFHGGKGVNPNGLYPGKGGTLLMVGFAAKDKPRGIYSKWRRASSRRRSPTTSACSTASTG